MTASTSISQQEQQLRLDEPALAGHLTTMLSTVGRQACNAKITKRCFVGGDTNLTVLLYHLLLRSLA